MIWGNGAMIAEVAGSQTATPEYRLLDHEGSLAMQTDNSGNVTGSNVFLPFGQLVSSTTNDSFQFTGLEQDTENSSDHAWFRNLSTEQSRWLRPDPYLGSYDIANPQSLNRYAYVLNNPLSFVDPSGLDPQYCTWSASDGTLISSFCSTTGSITVDGGISGFGGSMGGRPGLGLLMAPGSNRPGPGGGISGPPSSVAPSSGPQYSMADVCAASTLLNRGGQTFLDAVGIIPVENTIIKGVQFSAALLSGGLNIFENSAPTDALFAGATLGITTVDNAKVMTTGAEMVPVAGTLISAGATLNDLYGKNGMANYYNDCMAGKN